MSVYKGSAKVGTIYHSGTKIGKGYKGSTLVYSGQLSVYNIYSTNQEQDGNCGFFLGEPGANKTLAGGVSRYTQQNLLTGVIGTINSISGTPGTAGSSLYTIYAGGNHGPFGYLESYNDSYRNIWYRYTHRSTFVTTYVLMSPFHTTVGSQVIFTSVHKNVVFSTDASTITLQPGGTVYNAASTLRGTFRYK